MTPGNWPAINPAALRDFETECRRVFARRYYDAITQGLQPAVRLPNAALIAYGQKLQS